MQAALYATPTSVYPPLDHTTGMSTLSRTRATLLFLLGTGATMSATKLTGAGSANASTVTNDEPAVRAVLSAYEPAWNRHDMSALGDLFADDAHWVNIVGIWWRSKPDLVKAHTIFHETMFRETPVRFKEVDLRTVAPGVAIAIATVETGSFSAPDGRTMPASGNRLTMVLVQKEGRWQIVSGQNTVNDPIAAPHDPAKRQ